MQAREGALLRRMLNWEQRRAVALLVDSDTVTPYATYGARRAVGTHYGPTRIHQASYSLRHRRDGNAGTTILYHLRNCRRTHSLSVMTTGRTELLEHGHRSSYRRGRKTFQGLRAGRSSGRTTPEYPAASGRYDHVTFRERADASVRCTGLRAKFALTDEAWAR